MHELGHRLHSGSTAGETALRSETRRGPLTTAERRGPTTRPAMFTEEQLRTYLEHVSPSPHFVRFDFSGAERFVIEIKCDIDKNKPMAFYSGYIDKWIKSFSKFTATIWSARSSYTRMKTLLLQKNFSCLPIDYHSRGGDGHAECRARVEFKVKVINGNTDLNLFITINFEHSHNVYTTPATAFGDSLSDSDKLFFEYFDNGFNATTSKTYHELSLIEKHGNRSSQYLADRNVNPTIEHIKLLIDKMQSKEIKRSFSDILEAKKAFIKDSGGTLTYIERPAVVVIITPLMKKVISNSSLECVLVDSSFVKVGLVVTFLYVSNKVGALPIACVLHTETSECNFKEAFNILTISLQTVSENFYPKTFIVNDMREQKIALSLFFPKSNLVPSRWSICCEIWKWLCNEDLKINHRRRHSLMFLFKCMIYASTDNAHRHYTKLLVSDYFDSKVRLRKYIDYLWQRSKEWIVKDPSQLHSLTELSIRLVKEFMLRKCRFFNIIMMIDVVSKLLENHLKTLINTYIVGIPTISNYTKFFHRSYSTRANENFMNFHQNEYMIQYQSSPNLYYHVRVDTSCCDCAIGKQGRLCDHLGIIFNMGTNRIKIPILTNVDVDLLMKFIGLTSDNNIKCELLDDEENTEVSDGATSIENMVYLNECQRDCAEDEHDSPDEGTAYDVTPAPLHVLKHIKIRDATKSPDTVELTASNDISPIVLKRKLSPIEVYMKSLDNLNEQFQALRHYLQNNPNASNITAIEHLSQELAKMGSQMSPDAASNALWPKRKRPND